MLTEQWAMWIHSHSKVRKTHFYKFLKKPIIFLFTLSFPEEIKKKHSVFTVGRELFLHGNICKVQINFWTAVHISQWFFSQLHPKCTDVWVALQETHAKILWANSLVENSVLFILFTKFIFCFSVLTRATKWLTI